MEAPGLLSEVFASIQGEGPYLGRRHVFVRTLGCAVGCRFCDTPEALGRRGPVEVRGLGPDPARVANPVRAERVEEWVDELVRKGGGAHAVSITGGEPLEQSAFVASLARRLSRNHRVLLETAGTMPEALREVIEWVHIVSMDIKLPGVAGVEDRFDVHREFLSIARKKDVYVKVVVDDAVDPAEWERACRVVAEVDASVTFVVQPETRRDHTLACGPDALESLRVRAHRLGLSDVRVLPQIHKFLRAP